MPTMATNGQPVSAAPVGDHEENGRIYHSYRRGMYMYPCDESEKDRMDIYHAMLGVARRNKLHNLQLTDNPDDPLRILDIGCGTGIWAIDMADAYPQSEVVGIDLANIQPESIPPNLRFRVPADFESIWNYGENSWDMIHVQMACGAVSSWPDLYHKVFAHLKPGTGYIEQVEIDLQPRCDDNSLPSNSNIKAWYEYLKDSTERANRPIAYQHNTTTMLRQAGFIDVTEHIIRAPLSGWPSDPHQKQTGRWYSIALAEGLNALSLGPFTRVYKWKFEHFEDLLKGATDEIRNTKIHAYNNIHIITARKPL